MSLNQLTGKMVSVLLIAVLCASCATLFGQSAPELLNIRTTPDQARVEIFDESGIKVYEGKTPTIASLEKKKGYFRGKKYSVKISKDGFVEQTLWVDTRVNGWYLAGNIVFGGLIGWLIVDPATGAMWTLNVNEVSTNLSTKTSSPSSEPASPAPALDTVPAPIPGATTSSSGFFGVALLQDVPPGLQGKLVPVVAMHVSH